MMYERISFGLINYLKNKNNEYIESKTKVPIGDIKIVPLRKRALDSFYDTLILKAKNLDLKNISQKVKIKKLNQARYPAFINYSFDSIKDSINGFYNKIVYSNNNIYLSPKAIHKLYHKPDKEIVDKLCDIIEWNA